MTRDELEFSISQYLDGTLAESEQRALEERLATDAEARALYGEYQSLQGALTTSLPMPEVDWDQFASRVSSAVDRAEEPARSYNISRWFARPMRYAIAASVLIAAGIAFALLRPAGIHNATPGPTQIVKVDTAARDDTAVATPQPALTVAIVPPAADEDHPTVLRYADSVVQRPSRAMIVSAAPVGQDTSAAPF